MYIRLVFSSQAPSAPFFLLNHDNHNRNRSAGKTSKNQDHPEAVGGG